MPSQVIQVPAGTFAVPRVDFKRTDEPEINKKAARIKIPSETRKRIFLRDIDMQDTNLSGFTRRCQWITSCFERTISSVVMVKM